jgi:hypothetical protein
MLGGRGSRSCLTAMQQSGTHPLVRSLGTTISESPLSFASGACFGLEQAFNSLARPRAPWA